MFLAMEATKMQNIKLIDPDLKRANEVMNDTIICYCFGYTEAAIRNDYLKNGQSLIRERIAAEKKEGNCKCAETNPKGR